MTAGHEGSGGSLLDRVRRVLTGPEPAELARRLDERAETDPGSFDEADREQLRDLLGHEDPAVRGDSIKAARELVTERPAFVAPLAPALVDTLQDRPAEVWESTSLGEMDQPFLNDLGVGGTLFELAAADPTHLSAVADDLAARMSDGENRLQPHALFALARVSTVRDVGVPTAAFVEPVARTLRTRVERQHGEDGPFDLSMTVVSSEALVALLADLDHPDALEALDHVAAHAPDRTLAEAATRARHEAVGSE